MQTRGKVNNSITASRFTIPDTQLSSALEFILLTNFTSFASLVWRTNTRKCTDAIDARRAFRARLRGAVVDVNAAVGPVEAERADAAKPAVARLAGRVVVTRSRRAEVRGLGVAVVRAAIVNHRLAQSASIAVGTLAIKSVDHVDAFAILTRTVGALVNVCRAVVSAEAREAVALVAVDEVDASGAVSAGLRRAFINIWFATWRGGEKIFIYKLRGNFNFLFTLLASFTVEAWRACAHVVGLALRCRQRKAVVDGDGSHGDGRSHRAHAVLLGGVLDGAGRAVLARHRRARMLDDLAASAREALGTSAAELLAADVMTRTAEQARLVSSAVI
jgi:hypothetical protein